MTTRRVGLDIETTATTAQARRNLGEVRDDVEAVEGKHDIGVDVDDRASDDLADIRGKLDSLSSEDRKIALELAAGNLEREVRNAEKALGRLDRYDQDAIKVRIEARDNASKRLDAVRTELRELDGDTARVRVEESGGLDDIRSKLGEIGGSAAGVGALGKGGLIGGAAVGAQQLANRFSEAAIEAGILAQQSGANLEYSSSLLAVWRDSGLELGDLLDIMFNLNDRLRESPELAEELGINMNDGKDLAARFVEVVGILQDDIDDVGRKAQLSSQLFGEEGTRQVGRIQLVVDDLNKAIENMPPARVIDQEELDRALEFEATMRETKGHLDAILMTAGQLALGPINDALSFNIGGIARNAAKGVLPGVGFAPDIADAIRGHFGWGGDDPPPAGAPLPPLSPEDVQGSIANIRPGLGITVVNPPGSPTVVVRDTADYDRRNGNVPR